MQIGQREPLAALAEQPGRDGQQQETRARGEDEAGQQQPEQRHAQPGEEPGGRQAPPGGCLPAPSGQPGWGLGGDHRTMLPSNQVLMVPSCGPQVYGLIDCVLVLASDGSAASGLTPEMTG